MNAADNLAQRGSSPPARSNIVFGLVLVGFGMIFLLHNLDVHYFDRFWTFWPVALLAIGLAKAFSGRADERTFGWIMTFLGLVFLSRFTFGWDVHMRQWWPVIPIIIGVSMTMRAIQGPKPPRPAGDTSSVLRERAFVGGIARKNASQSFQGGELSAVMGGCEVDLREARMAGPQAVIDCFAMWGGIVIQIPPDWAVDPQVSVFAAGFNDQSKPPVQPTGRLVIRGTAVMAGIEVKN
jgi:predicted membrane protein